MEEVKFQQEEVKFTEPDEGALKEASGYVFYNTSEWTLSELKETATNNQWTLEAKF
jgi:type I restriction enzyme M protein